MPDPYAASINAHYGHSDLCARILRMLGEAGRDVNALTRDDLAPFDEFHGGGRASTRELARFAGLERGMRVLDVGAGIGGPARTLAAEFGCRVTGVDLTAEFCAAARMLTARLGMESEVEFHEGSALDLPLADGGFDAVWTQNTIMNVPDRAAAFREMHRVLRPGGILALEAVVIGPAPGLHYPVFWAADASIDHIATQAGLRRSVVEAGFEERAFEDVTARALDLAYRRRAAAADGERPALGLQVIVTDRMPAKLANGIRNYEEGRVVAVQALYEKPRSG